VSDIRFVHFGPGAFHRAHQADYVDRLLEHDPACGIAAVSLRTSGTIEALKRQQGRYTLAILDERPSFRTIAVHRAFLGPGDAAGVRRMLSDPSVAIVSSTVTEKGYCLAADGTLDFDHPDIAHDLAAPQTPVSIVGWLALGLADRRMAEVGPFTPLCCDNLAANGSKLGAAVSAFAARLDPELGRWIERQVRFPDTMVDSITPATDDPLRALVRAQGRVDEIPVSRESYAAWVVEDVLPADAPDLASAGVTMAADVRAWEHAKLRMLNGAHSTLAYFGLSIGHETVADAMGDAALAGFVERLIRRDIAPSLDPSPIELDRYAAEILQRFRNPEIGHRLAQIAWDGSQKLPYRLLDTIADALAAGRSVERLAAPIAAWMLFVQRHARAGAQIVDPLAPRLAEIGLSHDAPERLLALREIFPAALAGHPIFREAVLGAARMMREEGPRACLAPEGVSLG
jgi:fructuronate reductase